MRLQAFGRVSMPGTLALLVGSVTLGCAGQIREPDEQMRALLRGVGDQYRHCSRYDDSGVVVSRADGHEYARFATSFERGRTFSFEFGRGPKDSGWERIAGEGDDAAVKSTVSSPLAVARGVSGASSTRVPGMLLGGPLAAYSVPDWENARFADWREDGASFVVRTLSSKGGSQNESWFWFGTEDRMLRGVVVRRYVDGQLESEYATSYRGRCSELKPPGGGPHQTRL